MQPKQTHSDYAIDILSSWYVLEFLNPQMFSKPHCSEAEKPEDILSFVDHGFPWECKLPKDKSKNDKCKIYYHILLGSLLMEPITNLLCQKFGQQDIEAAKTEKFAALGYLTVDVNGVLIKDGVAISSFAWAYPKILSNQMHVLTQWPKIERELESVVLGSFLPDQPIQKHQIYEVFQKLLMNLEIPEEHILAPFSLVEVHQWGAISDPPSPPLLNSFYLNDLLNAMQLVDNKAAGAVLQQYLGIDKPGEQIDVLKQEGFLKESLVPNKLPLSRWPTPGGYPLALLQQAAIQSAKDELHTSGLMAINGPPGTGKTTLLRDTVAAIVCDRAKTLTQFDDPAKAFTLRKDVETGNKYLKLFELDPSIKGFEILVASSNNKAVENISKELPDVEGVESGLNLSSYFSVTSNALSSHDHKSWGLIAAVLGNSKNRSEFLQQFWHEDVGLKNYLKIVNGQNALITEKLTHAQETIERLPKSVDDETPRSKQDALKRWNQARERFTKATKQVERDLTAMETALRASKELEKSKEILSQLQNDFDQVQQELKELKIVVDEAGKDFNDSNQAYQIARKELRKQYILRPNFFSRLLRLKSYKIWKFDAQPLEEEFDLANANYSSAYSAITEAKNSLKQKQCSYDKIIKDVTFHKAVYRQQKLGVRIGRDLAGHLFADEAFWQQNREQLHLAAPWLGPELQKDRSEVFAASLELHKAFIDAAAYPMRHNLALMMQQLRGNCLPKAHRNLVAELWSTLFLVVPVVSSTFASIGRMFENMPPEALGWLFIDEAGQATPQAAVGAIARSKRALVLGDPKQIEPISSLAPNLVKAICEQCSVNYERWTAPTCSATIRITDQRQLKLPIVSFAQQQQRMLRLLGCIPYFSKGLS